MKKTNTIYDCSIYELPKNINLKGNLSFVENDNHLPFNIKRVFFLYDIPGGESRGAHSHKNCHQFIIAASGAFTVHVNDGFRKKSVDLNRPDIGLHIPPGIWASEINFSSGSICLVLASHEYEEADYIRNYEDYLKYISNEI